MQEKDDRGCVRRDAGLPGVTSLSLDREVAQTLAEVIQRREATTGAPLTPPHLSAFGGGLRHSPWRLRLDGLDGAAVVVYREAGELRLSASVRRLRS